MQVGTSGAGRILSAFGVGAAVAALTIPLSSDRFGKGRALLLASVTGVVVGGTIAVLTAWGIGTVLVAVVLVTLAGVAMGGLPLVISLIPAEAVRRGDVGRALSAPIVAAEIVGGALLPLGAFALASVVGLPTVIGGAAGLLGVLAAASRFLRPPQAAGTGVHSSTGRPT